MTTDIRSGFSATEIRGIDHQIDDTLNTRFSALETAAKKLQDQTVIEPRSSAPGKLYDGQLEFADGTNWNPAGRGSPGYVYYYDGAWHALPNTDQVLDLIGGNRLIKGYYDQTIDERLDGSPLPSASTYNDYEYLVLIASGSFITSQPNLSGLSGATNDRIVSHGGVWEHVSVVDDFISAIVDDSAAGVITFQQSPVSNAAATSANELIRKTESDADDLATENAAKAYANAQDAAHVAAANPHDQYTLETDALQLFTLAAYGAMEQSGDSTLFPDLGAGWQDIDVFDNVPVASPRGVTPDLVNDTLTIDTYAVYMMTLTLAMSHNEVNAGRETSLRLYDNTAGAPAGAGFTFGTGRNVGVTAASMTLMFEVPQGSEGHSYNVQIGGGDTYSSVVITSAVWTMHSIGEYRGGLERDPDAYTLTTPAGDILTDPNGNRLTAII